MSGRLDTNEVAQLITLVEEAARSTEQGVKHFVEPAPGTLQRAISKRHHIVFGRRGSGKSSLLRKAGADLTIDRRPIAHVNLEAFKGHSYPDVLLSVLIATFKEFKTWMDSAAIHPANRTSFWKKLFGAAPTRSSYNRKTAAALSTRLADQIDQLTTELYRTDEAALKVTSATEAAASNTAGAKLSGQVPGTPVGVELHRGAETAKSKRDSVEEQYKRSQIDFLHRHIIDYQDLFKSLATLSGGDAFLFLDDLCHIRRTDQAQVVDYFHRVAKDHNLWLKIGTIRHRTRWYIHGDPPLGMKLGDDGDEIDLDLTLKDIP
jgi:hypothetical protein